MILYGQRSNLSLRAKRKGLVAKGSFDCVPNSGVQGNAIVDTRKDDRCAGLSTKRVSPLR